jgi:hypothetical protein
LLLLLLPCSGLRLLPCPCLLMPAWLTGTLLLQLSGA